jgi:hypothetical protein
MIIFTICLTNCKSKKDVILTVPISEPSPINVGIEQDDHGCLATAGYVWSTLLKDCIRLFEKGIVLEYVKESTQVIYVIWPEGNNLKTEVYIDGTGILLSKAGDHWMNADKSYLLKKTNDDKLELTNGNEILANEK